MAHMGFGALKQHSEEKVHIEFFVQDIETCVAKEKASVKKLTTEGTATVTDKCDEQKCRQNVLQEFFVKKVIIHSAVPLHI